MYMTCYHDLSSKIDVEIFIGDTRLFSNIAVSLYKQIVCYLLQRKQKKKNFNIEVMMNTDKSSYHSIIKQTHLLQNCI